MQVVSIAECSLGAFYKTFDLHYAIIGLKKTNNFCLFLCGLLRQILLNTIKFNGYPILEVKKKKFATELTGKTGSSNSTTHCADKLPRRGCKQIQIHTDSYWIIDFFRL